MHNDARRQVEAMMRAGGSDTGIARQLQVSYRQVRAIRRDLGVPPLPIGTPPGGTPEETFHRRAVPTDDGHLLWPGYDTTTNRGAQIRREGRNYSVHRLAFLIGTGREPVGMVRAGCDLPGCIHPKHVEDQTMRQQYNTLFRGTA